MLYQIFHNKRFVFVLKKAKYVSVIKIAIYKIYKIYKIVHKKNFQKKHASLNALAKLRNIKIIFTTVNYLFQIF